MGSVDAFELRRSELRAERVAIMNNEAVSPSHLQEREGGGSAADASVCVSDSEVAQSYIRSCCPESGIMGRCESFSVCCILLSFTGAYLHWLIACPRVQRPY